MSEVKGQGSEVTDYQPNSLNQYTSISNSMLSAPCSLLYDLNGNLTNDGVSAYTWDTQNQLIEVETLPNAQSLRTKVSFSYDFMGRRISKKVFEWNDQLPTPNFQLQTTHSFFYDGWNLVREVSTDLTTSTVSTNSYVWGNDLSGSLQGAGGVGGLLCSITKAQSLEPKAFYPCYDHNGNVEKVLTRSGAVVAAFQYDAFGNCLTTEGTEAQSFAFRFSTKYWDSETGLYYYGYRYYSPDKGRWINRDPLGEVGGLNQYGFVENSPVKKSDPLGLTNIPGDFGWGNYTGINYSNKPNPVFVTAPGIPGFNSIEFQQNNHPPSYYQPTVIRAAPGDGAFHHHGNWGGPGWAAGKWIPERYLKESDFDVKPRDARDKCYWGHDKCIWQCYQDPCKNEEQLLACVRACDRELSACLHSLPMSSPHYWVTDQGLPFSAESDANFFGTLIPFLVHGGLNDLIGINIIPGDNP
jgi:RHS repeat-associated protein